MVGFNDNAGTGKGARGLYASGSACRPGLDRVIMDDLAVPLADAILNRAPARAWMAACRRRRAGSGNSMNNNMDVKAMTRRILGTAVAAAMFFTTAHAAPVPAEAMEAPLAREVVTKTIELVESRGLRARQQGEYEQARAALLALFDGQPSKVDRELLFGRIEGLLRTLDTDGHTFLLRANQQVTIPRKATGPKDLPPPTFQLLRTGADTVLRWTPPPIVGTGAHVFGPYLKRFHDEVAAMPDIAKACALVVDLSEQSGGNAWPPFVLMHPLLGEANKANWVDRDGKRSAVVNRAMLEGMNRKYGDGRANPLDRFGSGPLAVIASKRTASAGEMLLVALLGEARVRSFGHATSGMTTANVTHALADGSTLVLTEGRYALGDGPVVHRSVEPMHPFAPGEAISDGLAAVAEWAARNSPRCSAGAGVTLPAQARASDL